MKSKKNIYPWLPQLVSLASHHWLTQLDNLTHHHLMLQVLDLTWHLQLQHQVPHHNSEQLQQLFSLTRHHMYQTCSALIVNIWQDKAFLN